MSPTDIASVVIAVTAAGVAVLIVPVVAVRTRSARAGAAAGVRGPDEPGEPDAVTVRLIERSDRGRIWRLTIAADAGATSVEIFTYRLHGSSGHWRHELMDAPLVLQPAASHDLSAPPATAGAAFDVALGWTSSGVQASRYLVVRADT